MKKKRYILPLIPSILSIFTASFYFLLQTIRYDLIFFLLNFYHNIFNVFHLFIFSVGIVKLIYGLATRKKYDFHRSLVTSICLDSLLLTVAFMSLFLRAFTGSPETIAVVLLIVLIVISVASIVSTAKTIIVRTSDSKQGTLEKIMFTAGYPNVVRPDNWYSLFFYLYLPKYHTNVKKMLDDRSNQQGIQPAVSAAESFELIEKGTLLKIIPNVRGITFNPATQELAWCEDIQEIIFRLKAGSDMLDCSMIGSIDIYKEGLLIGQVPISIMVSLAKRPIEFVTEISKIFERLFISYSHKDALIVDQCVLAYKALGVKVYLDKMSLRSGEEWRKKLLRLIDQSDVFQLYWSYASKESLNVKREWQHALSLTNQKGEKFIRPCYWEIPMPDPPEDLESFHFVKLNVEEIKKY